MDWVREEAPTLRDGPQSSRQGASGPLSDSFPVKSLRGAGSPRWAGCDEVPCVALHPTRPPAPRMQRQTPTAFMQRVPPKGRNLEVFVRV